MDVCNKATLISSREESKIKGGGHFIVRVFVSSATVVLVNVDESKFDDPQ